MFKNLKHDTFSVKSVMLKNALNNNQRKKTMLFNIVMIDDNALISMQSHTVKKKQLYNQQYMYKMHACM